MREGQEMFMKWLLLEPTGVIGRSTSRSADLRHFPPAFVVAVVAFAGMPPPGSTQVVGILPTRKTIASESSAFFRGVDRRYTQGVVLRHLQ
jgi:hypothetical protein